MNGIWRYVRLFFKYLLTLYLTVDNRYRTPDAVLGADGLSQSGRAPALVRVGDANIVRPEHAEELSRLLAHAELAVFPAPITVCVWKAPIGCFR